MARRYEDILTQKTLSGKVAYLPTIYPSVTVSNEDFYIIAREQDRMDLLANDFYGDPNLWWVISSANGNLPQNSLNVPLGTQLRIPRNTGKVVELFNKLNS